MGTTIGEFYVPSIDENFGTKVDPTIRATAIVNKGVEKPNGLMIKQSGNFGTKSEGDVEFHPVKGLQSFTQTAFATAVDKWDLFVNQMNQSKKLLFLGASIGEGSHSSDPYTRSLRRQLQVALQNYYETKDIGYVRADYPEIFLKTVVSSNWTEVADRDSYMGGYIESSTDTQEYIVEDAFKHVSFQYEAGGGTFDVYIDNVNVGSVDTSAGTGVEHSVEFSGSYKNQQLKLVKTGSTPVKIYGYTLFAEDTAGRCLDFQAYVKSGMSSGNLTNAFIDEYFSSDAPCIDLVMSNDTNMATLTERTQYIIDKCASNGKMIILLSTPLTTTYKLENERIFRQLCEANDNAIYVSARDIIGENGRSDVLHPNDIGYRAEAGFFCKQFGLTLPSYTEMDS